MITTSAVAKRDGRKAAAAHRRRSSLRACALAGLLLAAASAGQARADWLSESLRGTSSSGPVSWNGVYAGAQMGLTSMTTDFGDSASSQIAYILRNTALESEQHPSTWTTLPRNTTNTKNYGGFIGYNIQWSELVVGFDMSYNRPTSLSSSAHDVIDRTVTLSDGTKDAVHIDASGAVKLIDYATFRGRAGYAFGQFLPYGVVGVAVGRFNYNQYTSVIVDQTPAGGSTTRYILPPKAAARDGAFDAGFVVGLGMDVAIMPNLFLRAEWEYVGFAPLNGIRTGLNTGRVGIALRF